MTKRRRTQSGSRIVTILLMVAVVGALASCERKRHIVGSVNTEFKLIGRSFTLAGLYASLLAVFILAVLVISEFFGVAVPRNLLQGISDLVGDIAGFSDLGRVGEALKRPKRNPQQQKHCGEDEGAQQRVGIDGSAECWASCRHQIEV